MFRRLLVVLLFLGLQFSFATGVAVVNASTGQWLRLDSNAVVVKVSGQIAETKITGYYKNQFGTSARVKYAFPLPSGASATNFRYRYNGVWTVAGISATQQDTSMPGGGGTINANLKSYLGTNALYIGIPKDIYTGEGIAFELTYVQFLPYNFGSVTYEVPTDYHLLQSTALALQTFNFELTSERIIDSCKLVSTQQITSQTNTPNHCTISSMNELIVPSQNYKIVYILNSTNLGLYGYSSKPALNLQPDSLGGFMAFVAEPANQSTEFIKKYFTLIVDCSGSMDGSKMIQARQAANYIIDNLNEGDYFNIIKFADYVYAYKPTHVPFNPENKATAQTYINGMYASGSTNISGAFGTAVPQFSSASDSTANIIIFMTDGLPTYGITTTNELLAHIRGLVTSTNKTIYIFPFGIGYDVDTQLLSLIGQQNNGIAQFLGTNDVYASISSFYNLIRNPVLLSPSITFTPPVISEYYPKVLPNMYKGQQLILSGRYTEANPVSVTLSGKAFNRNVSYTYNINLVDSAVSENAFLPKIWAKKKIDDLYAVYQTLSPTSVRADSIKRAVIDVSQRFGVISPFTSFSTDVKGVELASFSSLVSGNSVELKWNTVREVNLSGFAIERKGENGEFIQIGFIKSSTYSNKLLSYNFVDDNLVLGSYNYRLKMIGTDGSVTYSEVIKVDIGQTRQFELCQNYPNPFNPSTKIKFTLSKDGFTKLTVYNLLGAEVAQLVNENKKAGTYEVEFNAKQLTSGTYIYKLESGENKTIKKMIFLK